VATATRHGATAEALQKLISISQAGCRVDDTGAAKTDVSRGGMRKKGELGDDRNDKYEQLKAGHKR